MPKSYIVALVVTVIGVTVSTLNQWVWETSGVVALICLFVIITGCLIGPLGEGLAFFFDRVNAAWDRFWEDDR